MNRKKILPIHMGGTIGSVTTQEGAAPGRAFSQLIDAVKNRQVAQDIGLFNRLEIAPALTPAGPYGLDSSWIKIKDIQKVIEIISNEYAYYDGFLITHGTNTLAFTAALLSFGLRGLQKPVVLTGSQRLLEEKASDALTNLGDALAVAASERGGVWVVFNGVVMRGVTATKIDSEALRAFVSVSKDEQPLTEFLSHAGRPGGDECFSNRFSDAVDIFYLSQTITPTALEQYLEIRSAKGLVVLTYGLGGHREELWEVLGERVARGNLVVAKSQCIYGRTDLSKYRAGRMGADRGVWSASILSLEATFAKLSYMIGNDISDASVWSSDLAGELTTG